MQNWNDNLNSDETKKKGIYPKVVRSKTIGIEALALRIARGRKWNAIETRATLELMLESITEELLDGNHVCFEGFGTFSLTAQCKKTVTNPDEIRAESIEVKRMVFTPSPNLKKRFKTAKFTKVESKTKK